jgi:hypothetical protein
MFITGRIYQRQMETLMEVSAWGANLSYQRIGKGMHEIMHTLEVDNTVVGVN